MPSISFDADGGHSASSTLTVANNEVVHIYNATDYSVSGTYNVAAAAVVRVVDSEGRAPKNARILNKSGIGSIVDAVAGTAGTDPEIEMEPGGSIFLQFTTGGASNFAEDSVTINGHTTLIDNQHVYFSLTDAIT